MTAPKALAAGRWSTLDSARQAHLKRARECSALTLPSILPPEGADENTPLPTPWQTMGARCVNNLSSKIVLSLMPPNSPCMRFIMDQKAEDALKQQMGDEQFASEVESVLAKREREVQQWMEKARIRVPSFRIMRLLIITGNALTYRQSKSKALKVYRLDQYVCRRNGQGDPVEIITNERVSPESLPESMRGVADAEAASTGKQSMVNLYTYCRKIAGKWSIRQEACGQIVPGSQGKMDDESFPFNVLIWSLADGENYGRGHVEEHLGDFISLEGLTKALVEASASSARLLFLVNPNGVTSKRELINTANGGFATGTADDVTVLRVEKANDLSIVAQQIQTLKDDLSFAFLMHASIQRSGERVTAEEIRFMAQDIEDGLGGIYSILAQEYQLPLVQWALKSMETEGSIDKLPQEITVSITTGLEALGRNQDLDKLDRFMQKISFLPPEAIGRYLDISGYLKRVATSVNLDTTGLIKTAKQLADEDAQAKQEAQQQRIAETMTNSGVAKEMAHGMMSPQQQQ